jgi:hypothetical protein
MFTWPKKKKKLNDERSIYKVPNSPTRVCPQTSGAVVGVVLNSTYPEYACGAGGRSDYTDDFGGSNSDF